MGARERLRAFIIQNSYAHDMPYRLLLEGEEWGTGPRPDLDIPDEEYPAVVDGLLDAYCAEVLREAHDAIRADLAKLPEAEAFSYGAAYQQGMDWAARVVDQMIAP